MASENRHPLAIYLDRKGVKPWRFAAQHGIPPRTIYSLLNGPTRNPMQSLMQQIETATDGVVTVQMQSDWARENAARAAKGKKNGRQHRRS